MKLYAENCAACHMGKFMKWDKSLDEDGHVLLMVLDIPGTTLLHNYFMSLNMVLKNQMIIYLMNYDEDVWSILEFIKSTWPEKILNKYNSHFI